MDSSSRLTQIVFNGKNIRPFTGGFFVVSVIALVLLILASALKCYLIPQIISLIS